MPRTQLLNFANQSNSQRQSTSEVGNLSRDRHDTVREIIGSNVPPPAVGNLGRRRRDGVTNTMGSSQPSPPVGNLNGFNRYVVRANMGSGFRIQENESGS